MSNTIRHHRRHHSWPHCGSELCMRAPSSAEFRLFNPTPDLPRHPSWSFQQAASIPPITEDGPGGDDAEMAGIVRQSSRTHRLWSRPIQGLRPSDVPVSAMADSRKHVHRSVLRRLIRRPALDKTRSLFVMPTMMTVGDQSRISGWMPPRWSARPVVVVERSRAAGPILATPQFMAERRHRRCHSEQPRSWKEPSVGLWTLQEE
ncbi:hypothetical protein N7468_006894 [Penicillium chermesinum]|uniref:Uncharacterized protein n=1 Tax=Penicillium chermesinum TaxID=63820 RepID=A0A9W9NVW6_9EURO|nr:uncharacterized protein N7468_006894 [Penicillium chermesinum]KAJ5225669.1 hypothetical protein N7468_006894 [Penicillium chermesinum]KAJ6161113.1 hypothetical protein N7470_004509 [Penicillium chermesinum]